MNRIPILKGVGIYTTIHRKILNIYTNCRRTLLIKTFIFMENIINSIPCEHVIKSLKKYHHQSLFHVAGHRMETSIHFPVA